jgi:S-adenosylmethionine decarboxylase
MGVELFFEGTEKKIELLCDPSLPSLRQAGEEFWERVAVAADARILSRISSAVCDAYLLSESSLFVYDHKVVMITCGRTRLTGGVLEILGRVPPDKVQFFTYERKNEVFPHHQRTSFFEDVELLDRHLPGRAFKFGDEDDHHLYLFHLGRPYHADGEDVTVELLMYGLEDGARRRFRSGSGNTARSIREFLDLPALLPGFRLDDHLFEPEGYSVNGLCEDRYWTLHVTPSEISSYASFETNHSLGPEVQAAFRRLIDLLRPRAFDVVAFDQEEELHFATEPYQLKTRVEQDLEFGYNVRFLNFFRPQERVGRPLELPISRPAARGSGPGPAVAPRLVRTTSGRRPGR